jgi:hypothetical protein
MQQRRWSANAHLALLQYWHDIPSHSSSYNPPSSSTTTPPPPLRPPRRQEKSILAKNWTIYQTTARLEIDQNIEDKQNPSGFCLPLPFSPLPVLLVARSFLYQVLE